MQVIIEKYKIAIVLFLAIILCYGISKLFKHPKKQDATIQINVTTSVYDTTARQKLYAIDSGVNAQLKGYSKLSDKELQAVFDSLYNR